MLPKTFSPFPILRTERLTLRRLLASDEQEIFTLRTDANINKYLDRKIAGTMDDAKNFIHTVNEHIKNNESLYWAITFHNKDNLVGTICLYNFSDKDHYCEIGYELLTNFQGQGIMQEAAQKVIDYAFNTIGVQKIEACFHKDNQQSIKLLGKLSFESAIEPGETSPELLCYHLIIAPEGKHQDT